MLKTMNKKLKIVLASLLLVMTVFAGLTLADLLEQANSLTNTFTIGSIDTEIEEDLPAVVDNKIPKQPKIKNTGKNDALVRARVTVSPQSIIDEFGIDLEMNTEYWTAGEDGYWYYKNLLKPSELTEPLFNSVEGNGIVSDGQINVGLADLEIAIYHEAIQSSVLIDGDNVKATTGDITNVITSSIWKHYESLND